MSSEPSKVEECLADVARLACALGLEADFFQQLWREDDWTFVLKLHALIEAAIADALVSSLNAPELKSVFTRLPLSDRAIGKLEFARALEIIDADYKRFLRAFSEVRNLVAHDVTHSGFQFAGWVASLDPKKIDSLSQAFGVGLKASLIEKRREFVDNARFVIWLSALTLFTRLGACKELHAIRRELAVRDEVLAHLNDIFTPA